MQQIKTKNKFSWWKNLIKIIWQNKERNLIELLWRNLLFSLVKSKKKKLTAIFFGIKASNFPLTKGLFSDGGKVFPCTFQVEHQMKYCSLIFTIPCQTLMQTNIMIQLIAFHKLSWKCMYMLLLWKFLQFRKAHICQKVCSILLQFGAPLLFFKKVMFPSRCRWSLFSEDSFFIIY